MDSVPTSLAALALGILIGASAGSWRSGGDRMKSGRSTIDVIKLAVLSATAQAAPFLVCVLGERRAKAWRTLSEGKFQASRGGTTSAQHVAIIMDGNRRYGRAKYKDALKGHWDGGQTLVDTVRWCMEEGVQVLTVYAFSTENWKREEKEVEVLMTIFVKYAERCEQEAVEKDIRIRVFCTDRTRLPPGVIAAIDKMERNTADKTGFSLNLCVSYGSRGDIAQAARSISTKVLEGAMRVEEIDEQAFGRHLVTAGVPDPDILIRTSGEYRLSNYLLFELAYTEMFFLEKFWPELTKADLKGILEVYDRRHRRFGV